MYAPIATSLLVFMLLLNSSMNRRNSTTKNVICKNYEKLNNSPAFNETSNELISVCNCTSNDSATIPTKYPRKEIRELSAAEYSQMVNALWLSTDTLILSTDNIIHECGVANFLDLILQKQIGLPVLMPYWDYRLDLALVKPTESLIFEQISTYNKNDQLGTNFSDLAQIISEQILLKRDQSMDDQIYQLLDNNADQKWMEYKQAFELSDYGDRKENAKILKLLLLISIDIGIGSEAQSNDYRLCKEQCLNANNWLNWDERQQKCLAKDTNHSFIESILNDPEMPLINRQRNTTEELKLIEANKALLIQEFIPKELNFSQIQGNSTGTGINQHVQSDTLWPNFEQILKTDEDEKMIILVKDTPKKVKQKKNPKKSRKLKQKTESEPSYLTAAETKTAETPVKSIVKDDEFQYSIKKAERKAQKKKKTSIFSEKPHRKKQQQRVETFEKILKSYDSDGLMEGVNDLDLLLPYLRKPKLPKGTIPWKANKTPFPVVYFTVTIIEGSLPKRLRRPPSNKKRSEGARIFLMGLNMPTGYTQITEGSQLKNSNAALVRTLNPHTSGPFVEFKIRVENKYGSSCKQLCLDSNHRYRRCSRRVVRLSTYKKFSDPIPFYQTANDAIDAQWTGRGYYRRRKFDYLLFRCN